MASRRVSMIQAPLAQRVGTRTPRSWSTAAAFRMAALLVLVVLALTPSETSAHPLGDFTINRYSRLEFSETAVDVIYVLDFAEIPTFQEMASLDTNGNGAVDDAEADAYLTERMPALVGGLQLVVSGEALTLEVVERSIDLLPGQAGLQTLRIEARLTAQLPPNWRQEGTGHFTDRNYQDRLGWREIIVQGSPGVAIEQSSASATDVSNELRSYPEDDLSSPLNQAEAIFTLAPGEGVPASTASGHAAERVRETTDGGWATDRVTSLVTPKGLTPAVIAGSLALALFWGAAHALSPGHGKTVVAAYLIGARGTAKHAAFLGLTVTLTHTAGVFALGLVTLYLSHYILPEDLYPWLGVASGLLVVAIGVSLAYQRLHATIAGRHRHSHDHAHSHGHIHHHHDETTHHASGAITHTHDGSTHTHLPPDADGSPVTWRALLALGVSGGLVPCPSALVLLLGAISLDRLQFGLILVVAFSLGLALVLTGIGLLLVYARKTFERLSLTPRVLRLLPIASAVAVSIAGLAIAMESLRQTAMM